MSAAFHIHASIIQDVPGGPSKGEYKKVHRSFTDAIADFARLIAYSEDAELRWSS